MSIRFKEPVPIRPVLATELSDEGRLQHLARTIRRVETILNFKEEFGRGDRPDWIEFANEETIWESYARIKAEGK